MAKYIGKRLSLMFVSLIAISLLSFTVIELPPGNYLTLYVNQLRLSGMKVDDALIKSLEVQYGLGQPFAVRYVKWISGILLRGDFGRSFAWREAVSTLVMDRLPYTVTISVLTLLFTYLVSIPIGIYSATHQYSLMDYLATVFGFIGVATPSFLLALFLMYWLLYPY